LLKFRKRRAGKSSEIRCRAISGKSLRRGTFPLRDQELLKSRHVATSAARTEVGHNRPNLLAESGSGSGRTLLCGLLRLE